MTTSLLLIREYIRNFYVKYEDYVVPGLKFLLALTALAMINGELGYMEQLDSAAAVLVVSLVCSFMPRSFILLVSAGFVVLHLYDVSLECAVVTLLIFLLLFLLFVRFSSKSTLLVLLTPMLFALKMPYAAPLLAGLLGNPLSSLAVACGVVVYYTLSYMSANASFFGSTEAESMIARFREILDGILKDQGMLVVVAAFVVTVILVYLVRRLSVDYAWTIAIVAGALLDIVILLIGDLIYDTNFSILGVLFGSILSVAAVFAVQFFRFNLDYTRTEKVQFEDDEYYYYVKAVPKMAVATPEKKVKKITTQRNKRSVKHAHVKGAVHK